MVKITSTIITIMLLDGLNDTQGLLKYVYSKINHLAMPLLQMFHNFSSETGDS